jgi:ribosomal-protein-alanine N-acetyltransferase
MGEPFARQGYMTAAVRAVAPFAFSALGLHRLEAACIPTNTASMRLLEKCGFVREGLARQYLCINGQWQDHVLYARLRDDPAPPAFGS